MATTRETDNMHLTVPLEGQQEGPEYATNINDDLDIIDEHNHTPGKRSASSNSRLGYLSFGSNAATDVKALKLDSLTASLGTDQACAVTAVDGDLYWNNGSGTPVQITAGGAINASSIGGITGMSGTTAGVAFNSASSGFVFTKAPNTASLIAVGDVLIYDTVGGTNPITLKNPGGVGSGYSLTFPATLPTASASFLVAPSGQVVYTSLLSASNVSLTGTTSINIMSPKILLSGAMTLTGTLNIANSVAIINNRISTPADMVFSASTSGSSYIFSGSSLGVVYKEGIKTYTGNKRIIQTYSPHMMQTFSGAVSAGTARNAAVIYAPTGSYAWCPLLLPTTGTIVSFVAVLQCSGAGPSIPLIRFNGKGWDQSSLNTSTDFNCKWTSGTIGAFTGTINQAIKENEVYSIEFCNLNNTNPSILMSVYGLRVTIDVPISYDEGFKF